MHNLFLKELALALFLLIITYGVLRTLVPMLNLASSLQNGGQ